jgi:hypothetical protein
MSYCVSRAGLVHVNLGKRGAEMSNDLITIRPDLIIVELSDDEDLQLHGSVNLNIQKGHINVRVLVGGDAYAPGQIKFINVPLVPLASFPEVQLACGWWCGSYGSFSRMCLSTPSLCTLRGRCSSFPCLFGCGKHA